MERIHQMNVVPDVLPSLHPSLDLRLTFPEPPPQSAYLKNRSKRETRQVEPGVFLVSEQVWQCETTPLSYSSTSCPVDPKTAEALRQRFSRRNQVLHPPDGGPWYVPVETLCPTSRVNHILDVPDPENQNFTTYLHWLQSVFFMSIIT